MDEPDPVPVPGCVAAIAILAPVAFGVIAAVSAGNWKLLLVGPCYLGVLVLFTHGLDWIFVGIGWVLKTLAMPLRILRRE